MAASWVRGRCATPVRLAVVRRGGLVAVIAQTVSAAKPARPAAPMSKIFLPDMMRGLRLRFNQGSQFFAAGGQHRAGDVDGEVGDGVIGVRNGVGNSDVHDIGDHCVGEEE